PLLGLSALGALWLAAVDAPVDSVTVYSDRARVVRTARLSVSGSQRVELPLLLGAGDPSSIRVEDEGAEVVSVDLRPVDEEALPTTEARRLVAELERLEDQLAQARAEREVYAGQLAALGRVKPTASAPSESDAKRPSRLDASGWSTAADFLVGSTARLQEKVREVSRREEALEQELALKAREAHRLGATPRRSGLAVVPTLSGNGPATLRLSYFTSGARWYPSYTLRLEPESNRVQVSFSGLVSQESGEDWDNAFLTLSTAIPSTSTAAPKLATWKIGQRERFIPTPTPLVESFRPPPPVPAPPPPAPEEDAHLRSRLLALAGQSHAGALPPPPPPPQPSRDSRLDEDSLRFKKKSRPRPQRRAAPSYPAPSSAPSAAPAEAPAMEYEESVMEFDALDAGGSSVGLAPPPAWRRPVLDARLPASLAGGYALSFASTRRESVRSGGGQRRVPLFTETWPVQVERTLYPAVTSSTFLVAELRSPSKQVLPAGEAQLFVGADPAGSARLPLVSPGEPFTLPLGVDPSLRPVRNVQVLTSEKGLFSKDELTEYLVTLELANPYPIPL
ncbi:MAG TPA: DUF4139 domain-containing protein, partial [Myxococcaceae bacterium]|nr:DUF4139 domain-containing protein [Myxococcaceae bacterium]